MSWSVCGTIFLRRSSALSRLALGTVFGMLLGLSGMSARAQNADNGEAGKDLDIHSPVGDVHAGNDAEARDTGLPLYPGARLKHDEQNNNSANLGVFTSAFGFKLVVVNYDSDDLPGKIVAYYRKKLEKYGKVLECHTSGHAGDVHVNDSDHDSADSKELKCEGDNSGNNIELKAGTEYNQHVVSIEPEAKGSSFALVCLRARGKEGSI
jgi:hypothetical protein